MQLSDRVDSYCLPWSKLGLRLKDGGMTKLKLKMCHSQIALNHSVCRGQSRECSSFQGQCNYFQGQPPPNVNTHPPHSGSAPPLQPSVLTHSRPQYQQQQFQVPLFNQQQHPPTMYPGGSGQTYSTDSGSLEQHLIPQVPPPAHNQMHQNPLNGDLMEIISPQWQHAIPVQQDAPFHQNSD